MHYSIEGLPSEEACKSGVPGTGAVPAGLAQAGDPDAMRACCVLSRASTALGRSAPAGPRSPLRHRSRAAASSDARARATRPGEPAYPRAAATDPAGRRKGELQLPAEDQAARTTLRAGRRARKRTTPAPDRAHMEWSPGRINTFPSEPAEPRIVDQHGEAPSDQGPLSFDSRASMEEWSSATPRCDISTTGTSL